MFTGLVQATGTVAEVSPTAGATRITVSSPDLAPQLHTGDSIAVSGVCLTALSITSAGFSADLAAETIARTTLAHLRPGSIVNLELPTPAGSPLGGHIVQGHVDGTATLLALDQLAPDAATSDWRLSLELPPALVPFVLPQGSITIEGISLTIAALHGSVVEIAVIPHTYSVTSLHTLAPGSRLNIETDVLARYAQRVTHQQPAPAHLTEAFLLANGF